MQSERIVAIADVDDERASEAFKKFPDATRYRDFREMLDKEKSLDAVVVSTPDHTTRWPPSRRCAAGCTSIARSRLAHTIYEARRMREVAQETGVVTQMGQQGHALEGSRRAVEVVRSGAIGDVHELHVWTDRPAGWWPQGEERPKDSPPVPDNARLGPVARARAVSPLQSGVRAIQMARPLGLRHRPDRRHGRAQSRYRVLGARSGCADFGRGGRGEPEDGRLPAAREHHRNSLSGAR